LFHDTSLILTMIVVAAGALCLVALSICDLRQRRLPTWLNICLATLGLVYLLIADAPTPALVDVAIGLVVGAGIFLLIRMIYFRARGHHALGLGDAKFMGAATCWVGASGLRLPLPDPE